jgi:hypothetical protein
LGQCVELVGVRFVPRDHSVEQIRIGTEGEHAIEKCGCSEAFGFSEATDLGARLGVDPNSGCGAGSHDDEHRCNQ